MTQTGTVTYSIFKTIFYKLGTDALLTKLLLNNSKSNPTDYRLKNNSSKYRAVTWVARGTKMLVYCVFVGFSVVNVALCFILLSDLHLAHYT